MKKRLLYTFESILLKHITNLIDFFSGQLREGGTVFPRKWEGHYKEHFSLKMPFLLKIVKIQLSKGFQVFCQSKWPKIWFWRTLRVLSEKIINIMEYFIRTSKFWKSCPVDKIVEIWIWCQKINLFRKSIF